MNHPARERKHQGHSATEPAERAMPIPLPHGTVTLVFTFGNLGAQTGLEAAARARDLGLV
jgi:hypothetical protein